MGALLLPLQTENTWMMVFEELPVIVHWVHFEERPTPGRWKGSNTANGLLAHDLPKRTGSPRGTGRDGVCESIPEVKYGHGFHKSTHRPAQYRLIRGVSQMRAHSSETAHQMFSREPPFCVTFGKLLNQPGLSYPHILRKRLDLFINSSFSLRNALISNLDL